MQHVCQAQVYMYTMRAICRTSGPRSVRDPTYESMSMSHDPGDAAKSYGQTWNISSLTNHSHLTLILCPRNMAKHFVQSADLHMRFLFLHPTVRSEIL
jgi:hypothetical protein